MSYIMGVWTFQGYLFREPHAANHFVVTQSSCGSKSLEVCLAGIQSTDTEAGRDYEQEMVMEWRTVFLN